MWIPNNIHLYTNLYEMPAKYMFKLVNLEEIYKIYLRLKPHVPLYFVFFLIGLFSSKLFGRLDADFKLYYNVVLHRFLKLCKKYDEDADEGDEYKLILCVRSDLAMGKGKIAAQCGHASIGAYTDSLKNKDPYVNKWFNEGQRKVVLKISDYEEMKKLKKEARKHNINSYIIRDAGRTQIPSGSHTVIAIGPGPDKLLNKITGHLKLL